MRSASFALALVAIAAPIPVACSHREPPSADASPSVARPDEPAPTARASGSPDTPSASAIQAPSATTPSTPASAASSADPSELPQTHDAPASSGPEWDARVAALWDAIVSDDPDRAMPFFFPLGAYKQVKDVTDPAVDWKHRLVAAYRHDVHDLHARLGTSADQAKLVAFDLPDARARWVDPGEEWNKIGYYRVFGSRLRYEVDGRARTFDVKSLISWRGQWYVVHLSAIK